MSCESMYLWRVIFSGLYAWIDGWSKKTDVFIWKYLIHKVFIRLLFIHFENLSHIILWRPRLNVKISNLTMLFNSRFLAEDVSIGDNTSHRSINSRWTISWSLGAFCQFFKCKSKQKQMLALYTIFFICKKHLHITQVKTKKKCSEFVV